LLLGSDWWVDGEGAEVLFAPADVYVAVGGDDATTGAGPASRSRDGVAIALHPAASAAAT
jgi:hypothetical protein